MDRVAREKLKWKCRQGLLELDLVLARGYITAPDRMCAPTSEPFSTMHTLTSCPRSMASCFRADRRGEAGGACAHHDYVILHRFTFSQFSTLF
jgi:hypothetical protein